MVREGARAVTIGHCVAHNLLAVEMDITLVSTKHIPGDDNVQCDGLSRGKSRPEVGLPAGLSVVLKEDAQRMDG